MDIVMMLQTTEGVTLIVEIAVEQTIDTLVNSTH